MNRIEVSGTQLVYVAFALYANYQFFKWVFGIVKIVALSDFLTNFIRSLTPNSVIQKRICLEKIQRIEEKRQKEKDHQEALESHRKYQYTGWWNIGFIEEDRGTLFKGYEDIKWQWGNQRIDRSKPYMPDDSVKIAFMIFQEMAIYRWQLQKHSKWTSDMEIFWQKILPKQFKSNFITPEICLDEQLKNAIADFESDKPARASA